MIGFMFNEQQFQRIYGNQARVPPEKFRESPENGPLRADVMQSLVDISAPDKQWLVRFSAGMPGGIGIPALNAAGSPHPWRCSEFGMACARPTKLAGYLRQGARSLPAFSECNKTMFCREIRGNDRFPSHCIRTIVLSPELFPEAEANNSRDAIPEGVRGCYRRMCSHMAEHDFHCARAVFGQLKCAGPSTRS